MVVVPGVVVVVAVVVASVVVSAVVVGGGGAVVVRCVVAGRVVPTGMVPIVVPTDVVWCFFAPVVVRAVVVVDLQTAVGFALS